MAKKVTERSIWASNFKRLDMVMGVKSVSLKVTAGCGSALAAWNDLLTKLYPPLEIVRQHPLQA